MSAVEKRVDVIDADTGEVLHSTGEDGSHLVATGATPSGAPMVVREESRGLVLSTVADLDTMSLRLAKSELVPLAFRDKPANVFLALNMGLELGLSPAASLRAIHVVDGKPALSADAMVAIILSSGAAKPGSFHCVESSESGAIYEAQRLGAPKPLRKSFTIQEAERAQLLGKDNWKKYPQRMLEARAKAALARDLFPDVLHGIYTPEELEPLPPAPSVLDELKAELFEVKTEAELERLANRAFSDLSGAEQDVFRPLWVKVRDTIAKSKGGQS